MKALFVLFSLLLPTLLPSKVCNQFLLQSYLLRGHYFASETANPMCNSIKYNCCTTSDMLKIYTEASTLLEPALQTLVQKTKESVQNLVKMNDKVSKLVFPPVTNSVKKKICDDAATKFRNFDFTGLVQGLIMGAERASILFKDYHYSFYCMLCDYDAHQQIISKDSSISLDANVCIHQISRSRSFLKTLNVDLVNFFQIVQSYLDCGLYDKFTGFDFLFEAQSSFATTTSQCLDGFKDGSGEITAQCLPVCQKLKIGAISPNFEGDFAFINRASNYYGSVADEINDRITVRAEYNPLRDMELLGEPQSIQIGVSSATGNTTQPAQNNTSSATPARKLQKFRQKSSKSSKQNKKQIKKHRKINWRFLAEVPFKHPKILIDEGSIRNALDEDLDTILLSPAPATSHRLKTRLLQGGNVNFIVPQPNPLRLQLTKERYESLSFNLQINSDEIFKCSIDPSDVSSFNKNFLYEQGLNVMAYSSGLNFDVSRDEVLKTLNQTSPTTNSQSYLVGLLASFGPQFNTQISTDFAASYAFTFPANLASDLEKTKFTSTASGTLDPIENFFNGGATGGNATATTNTTSATTPPAAPATPAPVATPARKLKSTRVFQRKMNKERILGLIENLELNV